MLLKVIEANEDSQEEHCFQWYAPTPAALAGGGNYLSGWAGRTGYNCTLTITIMVEISVRMMTHLYHVELSRW